MCIKKDPKSWSKTKPQKNIIDLGKKHCEGYSLVQTRWLNWMHL